MQIIFLHSAQVEASRNIIAVLGLLSDVVDARLIMDGHAVQVIGKHALAVAACPNFSAYPAIVVTDGESVRVKSPVATWAECLDFADNPPVDPEVTRARIVSQFEFYNLFTSVERKGIRAAAKVNADVEDTLDGLDRAKDVDLDLPLTVSGIQGMEDAGLLGLGRAARILANLPPVE